MRTPHLCIGAGLNTAASVARGDLLIFLNAEVHYPKENFLRVFHQVAKDNPLIASFSCAFDFFGSKYHPDPVKDSATRVLPLGGDLATAYYMNGCGGSCFMTRKSAFDDIGGFVEAYHISGIEHEFYSRLLLAEHKIEFIPESLYWERQIESKIHYNHKSSDYLSILPFLQISPSYMENILLSARDLYNQVPRLKNDRSRLQSEKKKIQEKSQRLQEENKKLKEENKKISGKIGNSQEDKQNLQTKNWATSER